MLMFTRQDGVVLEVRIGNLQAVYPKVYISGVNTYYYNEFMYNTGTTYEEIIEDLKVYLPKLKIEDTF